MSMKNAVLGLVIERRGYGYDLIGRFNERFGTGWRLNQSTVYAALDALTEDGYLVGTERSRPDADRPPTGPRRYRKIMYDATPSGRECFLTWLTAPVGQLEPMRSDVFLKLGLVTQDHALAFIHVIDAQIDACVDELAQRLAAYELVGGTAPTVSWNVAAGWLINDGGISRLQADLAWLRRVRSATEALREHGVVPLTELVPSTGLPPGWR